VVHIDDARVYVGGARFTGAEVAAAFTGVWPTGRVPSLSFSFDTPPVNGAYTSEQGTTWNGAVTNNAVWTTAGAYVNSACPVDCVVSDWVASGACSGACGAMQQAQVRTVLVQPSNGGLACPSASNLTRVVPCQSSSGSGHLKLTQPPGQTTIPLPSGVSLTNGQDVRSAKAAR
jgi:hypothetical protein